MAIKSYVNEQNQTRYQVYVNIRSKVNPSLRTQRKVSGVETEKDAAKEEMKLIRECERELQEREAQGQSWGAVVDQWEKFLSTERKDQLNEVTRGDYIASIRKHTVTWWKRAAAGITRIDVREMINQLQAQGASVSYQNKMKVIINRTFIFGIESGLIRGVERSPAYGISLGRHEQKKPEILTLSQLKVLLREAKKLEHPWYPVWAMAVLTGMRNGELFALLWSDINWESQSLSVTKSYNTRKRAVKSTKSGDWRTVPISSELSHLLKETKAQAGDRTHVLPRLPGWEKGIQAKELRKFCRGLGLPSVKFHTLRACFATQLIRNAVAPAVVMKICGWKDLETMQRYIRLAGIETDGMTEILKVLPTVEVMRNANLELRPEISGEMICDAGTLASPRLLSHLTT